MMGGDGFFCSGFLGVMNDFLGAVFGVSFGFRGVMNDFLGVGLSAFVSGFRGVMNDFRTGAEITFGFGGVMRDFLGIGLGISFGSGLLTSHRVGCGVTFGSGFLMMAVLGRRILLGSMFFFDTHSEWTSVRFRLSLRADVGQRAGTLPPLPLLLAGTLGCIKVPLGLCFRSRGALPRMPEERIVRPFGLCMLEDRPFFDSSIIAFFCGCKSIFSQFLFIAYPLGSNFGAGLGTFGSTLLVPGLFPTVDVRADSFGVPRIGLTPTTFAESGLPLGGGRRFISFTMAHIFSGRISTHFCISCMAFRADGESLFR